ncbi:hypothetical protein J8J14_12520 [Roseomonas sp. SSH11]|uniref:Lipoprotein n=1 Tax=Pararoseomonas baculiformis TaxID=2820812 RepID=A0ABS4AGE2_9PROT|nr:hypothetical protein [Pararoseomonas baculiformis]MBP0445600.1 hypothetical protein [Pararoseomonas baculiformis]
MQLPSVLRVSAMLACAALLSACADNNMNASSGTPAQPAGTSTSVPSDPGSRANRGGGTGPAASGSAPSGAYNPAVVNDPGSRANRGGGTGAAASGSATSGAYDPAVVNDPGSRSNRGGRMR